MSDDIVIIQEQEFDALNDDTFGGGDGDDGLEEWDEDRAALEMARHEHGGDDDGAGGFFEVSAGHDFLELGDAGGDSGGGLELEGCLEPEGLESDALEGQILDEERVDFDGIGDDEEIPPELLHKVAAANETTNGGGAAAAPPANVVLPAAVEPLTAQFGHMTTAGSQLPTPPDGPAIINMVRAPPAATLQQQPHHPPPHHPHLHPMPMSPVPHGFPPGASQYPMAMPPGMHVQMPGGGGGHMPVYQVIGQSPGFPPQHHHLPPGMIHPAMIAQQQQQQQQQHVMQQQRLRRQEFEDPAIMAMGQIPPMGPMPPGQMPGQVTVLPPAPQHHHQPLHQVPVRMPQQPMHHHPDQPRHQQHHQPQQPSRTGMNSTNNHHNHNQQHRRPQHHHHQQQQHYNNNNNNRPGGNFSNHKNRNSFDDKNRETFGDDFVNDHHQRQQRPQQRYHYGEREGHEGRGGGHGPTGGGGLIMPGHVQTLGILRGAAAGGRRGQDGGGGGDPSKIVPTGNPALDAERQREQDLQRSNQFRHSFDEDEYAGLMTQRERQWVINIQLNQLKCENPYIDDYYYTVFTLKKETEERERERVKEMSKTQRELQRQLSLSEEAKESRMLKRDEEGAQLLLPAETSGTDAAGNKNDEFKPQQFANSLGKLQAVSVKAPRKIIDVDVMIQDAEERLNTIQKDSRNYKQILLELERMYDLVIDVEDCEKKLMALPTNTAMRTQVEAEKEVAVARLGPALAVETRLKRYFVVRKGKALLIRALRMLDHAQTVTVCTALFTLFSLAVKKDRDDRLLSMFWEAGMARHLASAPLDTVSAYLQLLVSGSGSSSGRGSSRSPPPSGGSSKLGLRVVLATPLGVSVVGSGGHQH